MALQIISGMQAMGRARTHNGLCPASRSRRTVAAAVGTMSAASQSAARASVAAAKAWLVAKSCTKGSATSSTAGKSRLCARCCASEGVRMMATAASSTATSSVSVRSSSSMAAKAGSSSRMSRVWVVVMKSQNARRCVRPEKSA